MSLHKDVKPFITLLLVSAAIMAIFLPLIPPSSGTEAVEIRATKGGALLLGRSGQLEVPLSPYEQKSVYSSDNPFDFFSGMVDESRISRLEILPYGSGTICNAMISGTTAGLAGRASFCIALSLRTGIPLYVSRELLALNSSLPKNMQS